MIKKLPYGISDYERIVEQGYYYVDKTKYIETLEEMPPYIMFLRPRKFGKTLFTSVIENYYDILKKDKKEGNRLQGVLSIRTFIEKYSFWFYSIV